MSLDDPITESWQFLRIVMFMRSVAPQYRHLAHYAADIWSDKELVDRVLAAKIPDDPDEAPPSRPALTLVQ